MGFGGLGEIFGEGEFLERFVGLFWVKGNGDKDMEVGEFYSFWILR